MFPLLIASFRVWGSCSGYPASRSMRPKDLPKEREREGILDWILGPKNGTRVRGR